MPEFTPTQARYLSFIHAYTEGFGVPPAESEIAEALRVQPPSVSGMLKTLVKKGLIQKVPGESRSIEILVDPTEIPPWKKKMHSNLQFWAHKDATKQELEQIGDILIARRKAARAKAKNPTATRNSSSPETIYRFKISLRNTKPPIWRRIETHDVTIEQLHGLIQTAMGWANSHMHEFDVGGSRYLHPMFLQDEFEDNGAESYANLTIKDWIAQYGETLRMKYMYDFGDGWQHDVVLEGGFPAEPGTDYPRCIAGKLACPPEDVGGVVGYYDFVAAITNPKHEQHKELLEWSGPHDPNSFDPAKATEAMQVGLPG